MTIRTALSKSKAPMSYDLQMQFKVARADTVEPHIDFQTSVPVQPKETVKISS